MRKFTRKLPNGPAGVPVSCAVMDMSQEPFYAEIDRENCETPDTTSNEHRALTYCKNSSVRLCGHTIWGKVAPSFPKSTQNALLVKCPGPAPPFLLK